ncbi:hypothetical protein V5O48_013332 [Marasmius crinis-equi]|uniref:Uncharacterized protein n=1 Tax=Marasmius crinis-equi TaxID=585013 RepID=A0ABR3F0D9_9AGAR
MEDRQIIPLACRFIPYDQWLVTHIDTSWKISELKSWFIAKCVSNSGSANLTGSSTSIPYLHVPPKPRAKPPRRPASPIVFAPEPKARAISPIRFAPLGSPKTSLDYPGGTEGSSEDEGTTIAMGYEEDDEMGESDGELSFSGRTGGGRLGRSQYLSHFDYRPSTSRTVAIEQDSHSHSHNHQQSQSHSLSQPSHHSEHHHHSQSGAQKVPTYDARRLMLVRFSTGQMLEDHYRVDDCSISPYELIEIHRVGEIFTLPRMVIDLYVQPYWEGWVKSLRVVAKEQVPMSKKSKGKRLEKDRENETGSTASNRRRRSKLDWRDRWVFVKDGVLNLRKERLDPNTAQLLPLDSLVEIRGSEQIGRSIIATSGNPPSQQRIICAKFRSRTTQTRFANPPRANPTPTPIKDAFSMPPLGPIPGPEPHSPAFRLSSPFSTSNNVWSSRSKPKPQLPPRHQSPHTAAVHSPLVMPPTTSSSATLVSNASSNPKPKPKPKIRTDISERASTGSVETTATATAAASAGWETSTWPSAIPKSRKERGQVTTKGKEREWEAETDKEKEGGKGKGKDTSPHSTVATVVDEAGFEADTSRDNIHQDPPSSNEEDRDRDLEHVHPNSDVDNNNSSSSGSLSSPVFAHSDDDSDMGSGEDKFGFGGYGGFGGYSYGYGFDRGAAVRNRKRKQGKEKEKGPGCVPGGGAVANENEEDGASTVASTREPWNDDDGGAADSSFVVVDASASASAMRDKERERMKRAHKKKEREKYQRLSDERPSMSHTPRPSTTQKPSESEWIVLDLGDDHAYKSFLRILHRHAPHSIFSSFLASASLPPMPALSLPSPATPNPTPIQGTTPSPSPIVFAPAPPDTRRHHNQHQYEIAAVGSHAYGKLPKNMTDATNTSIPRESESFPLPKLSFPEKLDEEGTKLLNTFGALPYPEWRVGLVTKARKSGMGGLNRAMEMFLWGDVAEDSLTLAESGSSSGIGAGDGKRSSSIMTEGSEEESLRRKRQKKADRKMTMEHENMVIGLERTESQASVLSKGSASGKRKSRGAVSGDEEGEAFYSADEGSGTESSASLRELDTHDSEDDSGAESSDAEWIGWMADLYRQTTVHRDKQRRKKEDDKAAPSVDPRTLIHDDLGWIREDDYKLAQKERLAFEPSGAVVRHQLLPAAYVSSPQHTPAPSDDSTSFSHHGHLPAAATRLSSPSSNESLGRVRGRRLSFGMSPLSEPPSTSSSPPHHPQSQSQRQQHHNRSASSSQRLTGATGLFHFASSGIIGAEFREQEFGTGNVNSARRPSMPTLVTSSIQGGDSPAVKWHSPPPAMSLSSPQPSIMTFSGTSSTREHTPPFATEEKISRRGSLTMGSLGRSSSKLRRKEREPEMEKERLKREKAKAKEREKEEREREKERERERKVKGKERERDETATDHSTGTKRRPRLSLSTGSRQNLGGHFQSPPQSPPPPPPPRNIIRRSGSSLMLSGGDEADDAPTRPLTNPSATTVKKKRAGLVREVSMRAEKLVQGLESALDFVDGRQ